MWNGTELIALATDIDDYGHVPYEIKIEEFPHRDYFSKSIDHNNLINIMGSEYKIIDIQVDVDTWKKYWYNPLPWKWVLARWVHNMS